ncbi:MAG: ammonia-forming cytochrome c nitrite reductase subunit c552 [Clostridia bacterium]|nr:ammonia-forming cytochrome c nitrite reductase subunit c552 [Clostridia bacterium]
MHNKQENKWLWPALGLALLGLFLGSLFRFSQDFRYEKKVAANAVSSIAEIPVPQVPAVQASRANGVVTAAEWAAYYPNEYATYMKNADNVGDAAGRIKYTETNPDITVLYQGMGFAFDYTEAVGHSHTLEDIAETTRPHKLANCLTCKTPDFSALVNALGTDAYSMDFGEAFAQMEEPISCYTCHANEPGTIHIVHDYMDRAMSDEIASGDVNAADIACAQCHIEYYFEKDFTDPDNLNATNVPYSDLAGIHPDAILAHYNEIGFVDYTNENTGVGQIKVQHPEFETFYGEGSQHVGMYTCADCHMSFDYDEETAMPYADHELISPLANLDLIEGQCALCHADLRGQVKAIQDEITGRENEISALLVELNGKLAAAIAGKTMSDAKLDEIRALDRDAQFYWDFVFVENSEGAHNSTLSRYCLDKAEELARQALGYF